MSRAFILLSLLVVLGFALAGCGTSYGPGGNPNEQGAGNNGFSGQDTNAQPEAGGLRTPAYTAAHNACSLYPLAELARQNNVKATQAAVAKAYEAGETTATGKKQAYQGCLDALNNK
jgi:hypothetical protein